MKFNIDGVKKIVKTVALTAGLAGLSNVSHGQDISKNADNINTSNSNNIEVGHGKINIGQNEKTYIDFDNKYFKKEESPQNEEKKDLLKSIYELEKKFKGLNNSKTEIYSGSIAIIPGSDLSEGKRAPITALNDKYITECVTVSVFNEMKDLKLLAKDLFSYEAIGEEKKLENEGHLEKAENQDSKHFIPEYYFVIEPIYQENTVVFNLNLVSIKNKSVETLDSQKYIFNEDKEVTQEEVINNIVIPNLINKIKEKLIDLKIQV